jgi:hypothetical protein
VSRCVLLLSLVAATVPVARAGLLDHWEIIYEESEASGESQTVGQADVREVQDRPPERAGPRDLLESAP